MCERWVWEECSDSQGANFSFNPREKGWEIICYMGEITQRELEPWKCSPLSSTWCRNVNPMIFFSECRIQVFQLPPTMWACLVCMFLYVAHTWSVFVLYVILTEFLTKCITLVIRVTECLKFVLVVAGQPKYLVGTHHAHMRRTCMRTPQWTWGELYNSFSSLASFLRVQDQSMQKIHHYYSPLYHYHI